jgi:hypothetical protein
MNELIEWDSFYVIIGSAAGALVGLQFVVMTLIAERPPKEGAAAVGAAFATPTIVHFSAVLLLSALVRAPWHAQTSVLLLCGIMGVSGVAYALVVARRMRVQQAYKPEFEDWAFHVLLPVMGYAMLAGAAAMVPFHFQEGLFIVAGAALLLLFTGIHNAWDAVAYQVLTRKGRD